MIKIYDYSECETKDILNRGVTENDVSGVVEDIIKRVRDEGDSALYEFTERFDGVKLSALEVTEEEIREAFDACDYELAEIIRESAENIRDFHSKQIRKGFSIEKADGVILGQKVTPLSSVGIYVPGGTASYPSTVLMNAIPAKLAGVKEVIMVTPPSADGKIKPSVLVAASIAGVDRIFKVGGAQAIAALSYGTQSIPKTVKIVGPGNVFVAEAKRQVFGIVDIDMIAGPSEILIIADETANPVYVAADMLSQAEHDKLATAVLVTVSKELAKNVSRELERQIPLLARSDIARASVDSNGKIIIADTIETAIAASDAIAPEHLELCVDNPFDYLDSIQNAGSVFLGKFTPEALGDYFAGTNHTLPTSGTAKFSSPLSVDDFIKTTQFSYYTESALKKVSGKIARFAEDEGLGAHAKSALIRFADKDI